MPRMFQGVEKSSAEQLYPTPEGMFSTKFIDEEHGPALFTFVRNLLPKFEYKHPTTNTTTVSAIADMNSVTGSTTPDQLLPPSTDS